MDSSDPFAKRRPVPILSRQNKDAWFPLMKVWLEGEGLYYTITNSTNPSTPDSQFGVGFGSTKDDSRAQYWIRICINEDDAERVRDLNSAKLVWESLKDKYSEKLQGIGRQHLLNYVNYQMEPETTIETAWTQLQTLGKKLAAFDKDMKNITSEKARFQRLLQALPDSYQSIRMSLDVQKDISVEDGIALLQEEELRQNGTSTALAARQQNQDRTSAGPRRRSPTRDGQSGCYLCDRNHRVRDCKYLSEARGLVQKKRAARRSQPSHLAAQLKTLQDQINQLKAFQAVEKEPIHDNKAAKSQEISSEEEDVEEIAALSKSVTSKLPKDVWIADSAASTHMTDQRQLFSGPLTRIMRRTIKVGGGVLYADYVGSVMLVDRHGNSIPLSSVLYVPKLGVNLLSGRQACKNGLKGSFDDRSLYLRDRHGKNILIAQENGGVYLVDKVEPTSKHFALSSLEIAQQQVQPAKPALAYSEVNPQTELPMAYEIQTTGQGQDPAPEATASNQKIKLFRLWHRRFGHLGKQKLAELHKVTTLAEPIPTIAEEDHVCEVCALTKMKNKKGHHVSNRKAASLSLISIDVCGPLPESWAGYHYFLEIVDNYSRKVWTIALKRREEVPRVLNEWRVKAELQGGAKLAAVRSDNATELKAVLDQWCATLGITPQYTIPHQSSQNGVAERAIQTTEAQVRAMLKEAKLPTDFWVEAAETDAYLRNRTATGPLIDGKPTTPEEAFTGQKPSIDHVRVWGCKVYSYVDPKSLPVGSRHDKFMDRARVGVFMGYVDETEKQYRLWAPDLGRIIRSHAVRFSESEKGGDVDLKLKVKASSNAVPQRRPVGRPRKILFAPEPVTEERESTPGAGEEVDSEADYEPDVQEREDEETQSYNAPRTRSQSSAAQRLNPDPATADSTMSNTDPQPGAQERPPAAQGETSGSGGQERAERPRPGTFMGVHIPKRKRSEEDVTAGEPAAKVPRSLFALISQTPVECYQRPEVQVFYALSAVLSKTIGPEIPTPKTYAEAVEDKQFGKLWRKAIQDELTALASNGTWEEVVPPKGVNIVTSKWVFKPKLNIDGSLEKAKARLVARGFTQRFGLDFWDTFAPTVRYETLRTFLAIVTLFNMELHQIDINNAFTESRLREDIYMAPPDGVRVAPGRVFKLLRSLYGLKQAARDWNSNCIKALKDIGFRQSLADPCLLIHDERKMLLLVYVDDIPVAAQSGQTEDIIWFKNVISKAFKIKDLGEMKKILGVQVTRDRRHRTLRLDQSHYLRETLRSLGIEQDKSRPSMLPMNGYDALRPAGPEDKRIDPKEYQHTVGKLMHLAVLTRPDLAFPIGQLSQYLSDPAEHHGQALKGLLRYLRSTADLGIVYKDSGSPNLIGYSDSDYAMDKTDRKSISGFTFLLANGPISWRS